MPFPERQRVAVEKRIPEKQGPRATLSLPSNQRYVSEEGTEEDVPDKIREEVVHPQDVLPEIVVQDESGGRIPEIVIQDSSDQALFGNLGCAPPALCTEKEADSSEGTVVSKVDLKLLESKVDQQKAEMDNQFDRLRAQNEMLIEMLKKLEQHREKR
jgi:hypothetical protein